jgi:hypothetical protein
MLWLLPSLFMIHDLRPANEIENYLLLITGLFGAFSIIIRSPAVDFFTHLGMPLNFYVSFLKEIKTGTAFE